MKVHFEFGTRQSENMTLTFTCLPKLVNMQTDLVYPSYTRTVPKSLEGPQPRLLALPGTRMVLGFAFSKDIEEAGIDWGDGNPPQRLDVTGRFATVELVQGPTPRRRASCKSAIATASRCRPRSRSTSPSWRT